MTLPPGRGPIPLPDIESDPEPQTGIDLAKSAAELNAWIDYLSHPIANGGPRIYRPVNATNAEGQTLVDMPAAHPEDLENDPNYQVVSALDGYVNEPEELFASAQGVSGVSEATINEAYAALTQGCFTFPPGPDHHPAPLPSGTDQQSCSPFRQPEMYNELSEIRMNWMAMRHDWVASEFQDAQLFENDLINFQMYVENGFLRVAEALVKYRAIHKQAGWDIARQMDELTKRFSEYQRPADFNFDLKSMILTGLVEIVCAVLTDGMSAAFQVVTLGRAAAQAVTDVGKTAKYDDHRLDDHPFLADTVTDYLAAVSQIEKGAAQAINDLWMDLNSRLGELQTNRRYTNQNTGVSSDSAPMFMDYAKNWRI